MLRSEYPFKISLTSSPSTLVGSFLQNFGESNIGNDATPPRYEMKMDINSLSVRLHIKYLPLTNQFTKFRSGEFQGSIGMIYIFEKHNNTSFNEVIADYNIF
ncbi:MAG: hypothetical protein ACW98F_17520, partial [Candidatus Hodarchaeales archaeon]